MTNQDVDLLAKQFEAQVGQLSQSEQLLFIERIIAFMRSQATSQTETTLAEPETWDSEELQQLLSDNHPMTTQEIVEAGLFGGWEDMQIQDSLEWVQRQRAKTRGRNTW